MRTLNIVFAGIGTFVVGSLISLAYLQSEDVYMQSLESIRLSILFLAAVISSWAYAIYTKK